MLFKIKFNNMTVKLIYSIYTVLKIEIIKKNNINLIVFNKLTYELKFRETVVKMPTFSKKVAMLSNKTESRNSMKKCYYQTAIKCLKKA